MKQIGRIENYYGGVWVKEESGKYYWTIEDYHAPPNHFTEEQWEEISEELYNALVKHNK